MKKVFCVALVVCLLFTSAHALTVEEFVHRFNEAVGEGFPLWLTNSVNASNVWFLTTDERAPVAVQFDPLSAPEPKNCRILFVFVRIKPRISVGVFMNNISAAMAAVHPEIPEDERLSEAMRALMAGDNVLGYGHVWDAPAPYNSEHMGQLVYEETSTWRTFLIPVQ